MIIRLTIASIDGDDFTVACVGSRFTVAPTDTYKVILTSVLENINIGVRPLDTMDSISLHAFTRLLKFYLLPLAHMLLYCCK